MSNTSVQRTGTALSEVPDSDHVYEAPADAVASYTTNGADHAADLPARPNRTSRRRLRGAVVVVYSTRVPFPRLHLDENCETLDATPAPARARLQFPGPVELGRYHEGRPCRVCCLEPVLRAVLKQRNVLVKDPVLFTASAQACPSRRDVNVRTYKWAEATDSSQLRLRRIARTVGLPVTTTSAGAVIFGVRERRCVDVVRMNLRTTVAPDGTLRSAAPIEESAVQTLWTLLNDSPPELYDNDVDLWDMAVKLSR